MKKLICLLLAVVMAASLAACGGTASSGSSGSSATSSASSSSDSSSSGSESSQDSEQPVGRWDTLQTTDEAFTLLVDLHDSMPTINTEPTEEQPVVRTAANLVAEQWLADKPNVTLQWAYTTQWGDYEWFTLQMSAGTCPDVISGFNDHAHEDWFLLLNDVFASPNYYEPGNERWIDMYPEYIMENVMDGNKNYIAVPSTVYPGAPTTYFCNAEIFDAFELPHAVTGWEEFIEMMVQVKEGGYTAFAPGGKLSASCWDFQFSFGPYYGQYFIDQADLDGDEKMDMREVIFANYTGVFSMVNNPAVFEMWSYIADKYKLLCDEGYESIDYNDAWNNGEVAVIEDGIWRYPTELSNTKRDFDFFMMVPPIVTNSEYTVQTEYTEAGPYQPQLSESFTVIAADWQDKPSYIEDYAVDFLKCVHNTENFSMIVEERDGSGIGAMRGCQVPARLADWLSQSFPIKPGALLMSYATGTGEQELNTLLEMWVKDMITDDEFKKEWDIAVYKDMVRAIEEQGIETDDAWVPYVPEGAE